MMKIGHDRHMMLDIETLDVRPTAVVLSIGAAVFNGYGILHKAHWTLMLADQIAAGRTISADTLAWWMQQDPEVMRRAFGQEFPWWQALTHIRETMADMRVLKLWAHSPAFDYITLDSLFASYERPWNHKSWLDTRTLAWLSGKPMRSFEGQHDAMTDAVNQAEWVIEVLGE